MNAEILKRELAELCRSFDLLRFENFDTIIKDINARVRNINELKKTLKDQPMDEETQELSKLVDKKFEYAVSSIKTELDEVGQELNMMQNKKKLAMYQK